MEEDRVLDIRCVVSSEKYLKVRYERNIIERYEDIWKMREERFIRRRHLDWKWRED